MDIYEYIPGNMYNCNLKKNPFIITFNYGSLLKINTIKSPIGTIHLF